jgi:hypothetical protein
MDKIIIWLLFSFQLLRDGEFKHVFVSSPCFEDFSVFSFEWTLS